MLKWLTENIGLITAIVGLINIIAIIASPIIALRIQKNIEKFDENHQRKFNIFNILLATRADPTSLEHVKALNLIDIEFYKEKNITDSWNIYRDHLNSYPYNQDKSAQDRWEEKRVEYMTNLLYIMSKHFDYDFNMVLLKKGAYAPSSYGILNTELSLIRQGFVQSFWAQKALKVELINSDAKSNENDS